MNRRIAHWALALGLIGAALAQAQALVNKGLATNPRDPQMRFWQGFIFEQLGQAAQAQAIYLALTQDYPELAEPHNNLGVLYAAQGDYAKAKEAIDAAYGLQTRYLDPQVKQQQQALEARLAEQGFVPGTPAYNQAMQNFMDTNQRAYAQARDSSIIQGAQIGQGDYRNAISGAQLNNSAASQALQDYITRRNQPINERNALLNGDQITYNQQLDKYNAQVAESNNRNQALSQLALALGIYLG